MPGDQSIISRAPMTYDECVEHHENYHNRNTPIAECERVVCKIFVKKQKEEDDGRED